MRLLVSFVGGLDAPGGTVTLSSMPASVTITYTYALADQTITFDSTPPADAVVGGATYTPTATASSGLPVAISIDPASTSVCSIDAGVVSFTQAGTCTVDADQAGSNDFTPAPQVQQNITVVNGTAPSITSADHTTFTVGAAGSFTVTTAPGVPASTTLSSTGALPAGVTCHRQR